MENTGKKEKSSLIVIGMAGSGKTTFIQQFQNQFSKNKSGELSPFFINLDPAVQFLSYNPDIDIRKSINYKDTMKKYSLGPNGSIMTCLNMFSAQFHNVIQTIENDQNDNSLFLFDTPGQIEVFTWSASGTIICQTLANTLPTAIIYVLDTVRCQNPNTFMSNMVFCCSIFYKMKLPIIVVFNKCDIANADICIEWMRDYQKFNESISQVGNYFSTLSRSMSLVMDEFYKDLNVVKVSSINGFGFDQLLQSIKDSKKEYSDVYLPMIKKMREQAQNETLEKERIEQQMNQFNKDFQKIKINEEKQNKSNNIKSPQQFNLDQE